MGEVGEEGLNPRWRRIDDKDVYGVPLVGVREPTGGSFGSGFLGIWMDSELGHGVIDGMCSYSRATSGGISSFKEPMLASVSVASLFVHGMR